MSDQRDWEDAGVPIAIEEFNPFACPACGSQNTNLLSENFDPGEYCVTSECKDCNAWWTAMYPLACVTLRKPTSPQAPCARRESKKEEGT